MKLFKLSNTLDKKDALEKLDVSNGAHKILAEKMHTEVYLIKGIKSPAANILKQDALSIGADLAVPMDTIQCKRTHVDALLIGTTSQIKKLTIKEKAQPFGLKDMAKDLKNYTQFKQKELKLMGVINANNDSFYSDSRFNSNDAIEKITDMIEQGASIIDIGAVSSRPGAKKVGTEEELVRIKDIADTIYQQKLYEKVAFSIDSYTPSVLSYVLERGFTILNDITGFSDEGVTRLCAEYHATAVIMHMQGTPMSMQDNPVYENILDDISLFFDERIEKVKSLGVKDIVLDVGIGFGKTLEHNLTLIKHLDAFKKYGLELMVGASRKSMIDMITPTRTQERLPGTLALHLEAYKNGASILRVHDVAEHNQAIKIQQALESVSVC